MTFVPTSLTPASEADTANDGALAAWAEAEARSRALLGESRRVLWANPAFRAAVIEGGDLWEASGCLQVGDVKRTEEFDAVLRRAGPSPSGWTCRRHGGEGALVFRLLRLSQPRTPLVVGVTVHISGPGFAPQWADFGKAFGLTPTENRTVRRLLEGETVTDVAEGLHLSVQTVRTHVRNAYAKLGVGSREALFYTLAAFRID